MEHIRKRLGAADMVLAVIMVAAAVLMLIYPRFFSPGDKYAIVSAYDEEFRLSLEKNVRRSVVSNGISLTIVVENGEVFVESADCPDKVCVGTGRISDPGSTIVCVPARLSLRIELGDAENEDAIVG